MPESLDQWFASEVLPHEAALMRYLGRAWPDRSELPDLRQEVYVRVYESAARSRPAAPKSFLFAAARNLMVDRLRRSRVIAIDCTQDLEALNVLVDEISPERRLNARQELRRLAHAFDQLSDKCRAVIWLRRVEGLSQREAAQRLGLNEGAVESHLSRGVRFLARVTFERSGEGLVPGGCESDGAEDREGSGNG
jgi:RNA polymerase sigma factor (sigma-70 family)